MQFTEQYCDGGVAVLRLGGGPRRNLRGPLVIRGGMAARPCIEDDEFREGVAAQTVRAMDGDTGVVTDGIGAIDARPFSSVSTRPSRNADLV